MGTNTITSIPVSKPAAYWAIAISAAALLFLASLHLLSGEFDPSWHMVSEYANGKYGWVLALMFAAWGLSSWILAFMLWSQISNTAGRIGLILLILAGIGEGMASIFDINHPPFHDLAGFIGIGCLPIAAMLISASLSRTAAWSAARKPLLWTANLTWISVLLLIVSFIVMVVTFIQSGGDMNTTQVPTTLPTGVIGLVGWTNRFLIVAYCAWVITVGWQAIRIHKKTA
jgi:Protein of unknown function (DUF998)